MTQLLSSPLMFTTNTETTPVMKVTSGDLGQAKDLVIVSLILVIWIVVILLFLHRWGEPEKQRAV